MALNVAWLGVTKVTLRCRGPCDCRSPWPKVVGSSVRLCGHVAVLWLCLPWVLWVLTVHQPSHPPAGPSMCPACSWPRQAGMLQASQGLALRALCTRPHPGRREPGVLTLCGC